MKVDDFKICKDDDGVEYVEFQEGPTKTRQMKNRDFQPGMFAVGGERCPVNLFKLYLSRRPVHLQNTGPFYLSIKTNRRPNDELWFKDQPMGVNKINQMMKMIITGTSLENSEKNFTNHSTQKTVVSKLKKANVERSNIAKVTGHRNIQSLDDYDEANTDEQRQLSLAISRRNNSIPQPQALNEPAQQQQLESLYDYGYQSSMPPRSVQYFGQNSAPQQVWNISGNPLLDATKEPPKMINTFNNCQVSFNVSSTSTATALSSPPCAVRKRRYTIESDTDSD